MSQVTHNSRISVKSIEDYLSRRRSSKERLQFYFFFIIIFAPADSFLENLPYFSERYAYAVIYVKREDSVNQSADSHLGGPDRSLEWLDCHS